MNVTKRNVQNVTIVDLSGRLASGDVVLGRTVRELVDSGEQSIVLNMQGLTMMDSSGLGELVRSKQTAGTMGTTIKLLNVQDRVRSVLELGNHINTFEIYDSERAAIASFQL